MTDGVGNVSLISVIVTPAALQLVSSTAFCFGVLACCGFIGAVVLSCCSPCYMRFNLNFVYDTAQPLARRQACLVLGLV